MDQFIKKKKKHTHTQHVSPYNWSLSFGIVLQRETTFSHGFSLAKYKNKETKRRRSKNLDGRLDSGTIDT